MTADDSMRGGGASQRSSTNRVMAISVIVRECETRFGPVLLAASDEGLCRITVPGETLGDLIVWVERRLPAADIAPANDALAAEAEAIAAFLEDGEPLPPIPVQLLGTPFQVEVWRAVRAIPYGETRSYADIAREIGHPLASRAVGAANAVCPLPFVIPGHRVIGADGTIKGFSGGIVTRAMLLELEARRMRGG
jgi:methylated-DNA-[protein]-cysteine S-methyltransferase